MLTSKSLEINKSSIRSCWLVIRLYIWTHSQWWFLISLLMKCLQFSDTKVSNCGNLRSQDSMWKRQKTLLQSMFRESMFSHSEANTLSQLFHNLVNKRRWYIHSILCSIWGMIRKISSILISLQNKRLFVSFSNSKKAKVLPKPKPNLKIFTRLELMRLLWENY